MESGTRHERSIGRTDPFRSDPASSFEFGQWHLFYGSIVVFFGGGNGINGTRCRCSLD